MRQDGDPRRAVERLRRLIYLPTPRQAAVLVGYAVAAALYVVIGVLFTDFLLSVFVGLGYLLVVAWLVPAAVRRAM